MAQIIPANGTIALSGIQRRHNNQYSPKIMVFQSEKGIMARLAAAAIKAPPNGTSPGHRDTRHSPPGRAILVRFASDIPMIAPAKIDFAATNSHGRSSERSVRTPRTVTIATNANAAPSPAAITIIR
jgi:hypothetical protein